MLSEMLGLIFLVCFAASVVGAVCGIGGGVIMKPVLDTFGFASVSTISFLSGCTVLAMSAYSIGKTVLAGESEIEYRTATPLAIGAAAGGVIGKQLFTLVKNSSPNPDFVGTVQSAALAVVTLGALLYTVNRARIRPHQLNGAAPAAGIGTILGILSSFLGIGGGPINLPVLHYFFSMETKTAAQNSLYTILFSQAASLAATLATGTVPEFQLPWMAVMVAGGMLGGMGGRVLNRRLSGEQVTRLFIGLMLVIVGICLYNAVRFTA